MNSHVPLTQLQQVSTQHQPGFMETLTHSSIILKLIPATVSFHLLISHFHGKNNSVWLFCLTLTLSHLKYINPLWLTDPDKVQCGGLESKLCSNEGSAT